MNTAIGTKVIRYRPMKHSHFLEKYKGITVLPDRGSTEGYHVLYDNPDGSQYDSWSPKDVFEAAYRDVEDGVTFGDAVLFLKQGKKVARKGWNGKGMWLKLIEIDQYAIIAYNDVEVELKPLDLLPWIGMKTADSKFVPWLASQTDMLAEDWMVLEC